MESQNMPDDKAAEILEAVAELRAELRELSARMEPLARLHQGNGKPSLEARLYHLEKDQNRVASLASWAIRAALVGLASAVASMLLG